jgi:hypothetical protein
MKKFIVLVSAISLFYGQSVINAINAPANASGLAWDGNYLWCGAYGVNGDTIFKLDPTNGTILKKIRWMQSADSYGLTFDQGYLWVNDHISGTDSLFQIDTITGARINALPAHKEYMAGLANDGTDLWQGLYYDPDGRVYSIDKTTGNAIDSIDIPSLPQPWGAAWDGQYLWVCNDGNYGGIHGIYRIDVNSGIIIENFLSPGNRPWGLTWDGVYLWVIARGTSPTGFVAFQIDLQGGGTPDITITPMSYDFGVIPFDSSSYFIMNISNAGDTALTIDTIFTQDQVFSIPVLSYPFDLAIGHDTNITVTFTPDSNEQYISNVVVICNDPDEETTYVALTGQGVNPEPTLVPDVLYHDFGDVRTGCVADYLLHISNQGYPSLVIDSFIFDDTRFLTTQVFPFNIACLDTLSSQIITKAQGYGDYSGILQIYSNDPASPCSISLDAHGDTALPQAGDLLWSYNMPDNVVCVAPIFDINNDAIPDLAIESYGTNTHGLYHVNTFWGNSSGQGVFVWGFGDDTTSGSWGDDCLNQGDDYNGDSVPDIILGTAWGDRSVYALDGLQGGIIWYYDSHWFDGEGGWVYSVKPMPDIDNDGIGEVLAGIGGHTSGTAGPRSMYCFSGASGAILWRLQAQDAIGSVCAINDVNGDSVPDAVCGAWGNSLDQRVYCVSGASSGVIYTPLWSYNCGGDVQSVIAVPDMNNDNIEDIIAGTWSDSVFCLSGADGARIWATNVGNLVIKVAAIPDLFGTDIPGIAVAHLGSTFHMINAGTGSIEWYYPIASNVWSVACIEDLDNDGKNDVLTGNQSPGIVYCLSGEDGSVIWSYNEGRLIYSIRAIPDISFDGYEDVVVGTQSSSGLAHVLAICGGTPGTSIAEYNNEYSTKLMSVYPGISRGLFNIEFDQEHMGRICIYDILGRRIRQYQNPGKDISKIIWHADDNRGRSVAKGIYFISYQSKDNKVQTRKVIVVD